MCQYRPYITHPPVWPIIIRTYICMNPTSDSKHVYSELHLIRNSEMRPPLLYWRHFEMSQSMLPSANSPLKWGHPSNQDTMTGSKGDPYWRESTVFHILLCWVQTLHAHIAMRMEWLKLSPTNWETWRETLDNLSKSEEFRLSMHSNQEGATWAQTDVISQTHLLCSVLVQWTPSNLATLGTSD